MALTARERRKMKKKLEENRARTEVTSYEGAAVVVRCSKGHADTKSHTHYDSKGRVSGVTWYCTICKTSYKVTGRGAA